MSKDKLEKLLENPPHCLLFEGANKELAESFARKLLKTEKKDPPDLSILLPEGKSNQHPMHAIKKFIEEVHLPPFEAERKVFVIHEADRMLPSSSNALLKTLEEPASKVVIILTTSHVEALLTTVVSRCFKVSFSEIEMEKEEKLSEQMFYLGCTLLRNELPNGKELPEIESPEKALSYLLYFYRDLHLMRIQGDPSLLFYRDKEKELGAVQGMIPPLELVYEKIEEILLATSLNVSLEKCLVNLLSV